MDAQGDRGRLERRRLDLPLGEDPDHRRRERPVVREDDVLRPHPLGGLGRVVVEDDDVDLGSRATFSKSPESRSVDGLDDDESRDRPELDAGVLVEVELLGVQANECADVRVQRALDHGDRAGIEPARGDEGRERVEVGVRVRDDDVHVQG